MSRFLPWFILVCLLPLLHSSAEAQTQIRNFNLDCGLIGKFARYPQHYQHCKGQVFCTDPERCTRKLGARHGLAILSQEELEAPVAGAPPQGGTSNGGLSLSVGVQGSVSAGGISAGGNANAGAGTDSGGGASGSASAGASAGAGGTSAGGGLGVGGL